MKTVRMAEVPGLAFQAGVNKVNLLKADAASPDAFVVVAEMTVETAEDVRLMLGKALGIARKGQEDSEVLVKRRAPKAATPDKPKAATPAK